jgi:DnaJ-class molecular chaperone
MANRDQVSYEWMDTDDEDSRCERCDGSGEIEGGWEYPTVYDCHVCGGTGKARDLLDEADYAYERKRDG